MFLHSPMLSLLLVYVCSFIFFGTHFECFSNLHDCQNQSFSPSEYLFFRLTGYFRSTGKLKLPLL